MCLEHDKMKLWLNLLTLVTEISRQQELCRVTVVIIAASQLTMLEFFDINTERMTGYLISSIFNSVKSLYDLCKKRSFYRKKWVQDSQKNSHWFNWINLLVQNCAYCRYRTLHINGTNTEVVFTILPIDMRDISF